MEQHERHKYPRFRRDGAGKLEGFQRDRVAGQVIGRLRVRHWEYVIAKDHLAHNNLKRVLIRSCLINIKFILYFYIFKFNLNKMYAKTVHFG